MKHSYLLTLMKMNMKGYLLQRKRVFVLSFFMMLQNLLFFVMWGIFFSTVKEVRGWQLEEVARMFAVVCTSVGACLFFFNGVRSIARRIRDGSIDAFLVRPKAALPSILMSDSALSGMGDVVSALLILVFLGNVGWAEFAIFVFVALMAVVIFLSSCVILYSLAFWMKGDERFSDQLFEMLIISSSSIIHGQPWAIKMVAFTVLPAGFISYLPVELMREFDVSVLGVMLAATVCYVWLAHLVFEAGVRRYKAANR